MATLLKLLADDRRSITYRPRLNRVTGSVNATILFQQVLFRWEHNEGKPFYKFAAPAKDSKHYREGDSWQEEVGFTRGEFEGARKKIATAVEKGQSKDELLKEHAIVYWRDHQNLTWYDLNPALIEAMITEAYTDAEKLQSGTTPEIPIAENQQSRLQESSNLSDATFPQPSLLQESSNPISEIKNTTEMTSKNDVSPKRKLTVPLYIDAAGDAINHTHPHWQSIWGAVLEAGKYSADAMTDSEAKVAILVTQEIIKPLTFEAADVLYFPEWVKSQNWNIDWTINSMARHMSKVRRARLEKVTPKEYDTPEEAPPAVPFVPRVLTPEEQEHAANFKLWESAFGQLKLQMPPDAFDTWVRDMRFVERRGDTFVFTVGYVQSKAWIEQRLAKPIIRTLGQVAKSDVSIEITLRTSEQQEAAA
jgi:hypothetical protein